jgi:hypothetical protein
MEKETYLITLHRPTGVTVTELKEYIAEAVRCWGGQNRIDHPLFYPWHYSGPTKLTVKKVKV